MNLIKKSLSYNLIGRMIIILNFCAGFVIIRVRMPHLCEECDENQAVKYCTSCDQRLCQECDIKIHNKGKRALHVRGFIPDQMKDNLLSSIKRLKLADSEVCVQGELRVNIFQKLNFMEEKCSKELKMFQTIAGDYYIQEAYKGNLMHEYDEFQNAVYDKYQVQCGLISRDDFEDLLIQAKNNNFFHITVRKFGDMKPLRFCSLLLNSISLESIIWILLSIKNDRMKPTDKLVLSRIKEYFLLKLSQKDWNNSMDFFYLNPKSLNPSDLLQRVILVDERETLSKAAHHTIKSDTDAAKDDKLSSSYYFEVHNERWSYEDIEEFDEDKDDDNWYNFKKYIDDFFGEESSYNQGGDSRSRMKKQKNTKNIQKWLSSVENDLSKPNSSLSANHSLQKILTEQSISRAIPGGSLI